MAYFPSPARIANLMQHPLVWVSFRGSGFQVAGKDIFDKFSENLCGISSRRRGLNFQEILGLPTLCRTISIVSYPSEALPLDNYSILMITYLAGDADLLRALGHLVWLYGWT
jgi:hypothetical protein